MCLMPSSPSTAPRKKKDSGAEAEEEGRWWWWLHSRGNGIINRRHEDRDLGTEMD